MIILSKKLFNVVVFIKILNLSVLYQSSSTNWEMGITTEEYQGAIFKKLFTPKC